jgi:polyferredoxin
MRQRLWIPWRWWRRAAQLALLLLFLWLFRRTESTGAEELAGGENLFFRLDPLAAAAAMLGARRLLVAFWPAAAVVLLTMVLGRFFCGWVCPLGTLLDYFHRLFLSGPLALWERMRRRKGDRHASGERSGEREEGRTAHSPFPSPLSTLHSPLARLRAVRYVLLLAVLVSAVFAFPLVGFVEPFSLLVRGMTFSVDPLLTRESVALAAVGKSKEADARPADSSEPKAAKRPSAMELAKRWHVFAAGPTGPMQFQLAGVSVVILAAIFALELLARRFWCRYLCPAGAMVGLLGRRALLERVPAKACPTCGQCASGCRMEALNPAGQLVPERCNLCMDCVDFCPRGMVRFRWRKKGTGTFCAQHPEGRSGKRRLSPFSLSPLPSPLSPIQRPVDLSRRAALAGIALGAAFPAVAAAARLRRAVATDRYLLRPPGAGDERTFLSLCVRCGECMKVCPNNALQPAVFEAGVEGVFSPRLTPRLILEQSYCEYRCTLCGQVCPSGAIPRLDEQAKHQRPIGKAYFDHTRCLPWAEKKPCICCEEMCSVPEKAIKVLDTCMGVGEDGEPVEIQRPYVDRDLCVGCGQCESKCPIDGQAAIRVQRLDAPDPGTESLLDKSKLPPHREQGSGKGA